jgi:hypothetical protein
VQPKNKEKEKDQWTSMKSEKGISQKYPRRSSSTLPILDSGEHNVYYLVFSYSLDPSITCVWWC